jgi:DNA-binding response OmpR family regulator
MRILIVEDEAELQRQLRDKLKGAGFVVDAAANGEEGLYYGNEYDYEAAVIDLGLPRMGGIELIRRLRGDDRRFPILILTARGHWQDKVEGLEAGADDYLTKPFAPKELSARIRALLRRIRSPDPTSAHIQLGDLELIPDEGVVTRAGEEVHLTKTEFRLLVELASSPGRVFSREVLLERVWGYGYFGDGRLVDVHIRRLRTKVEADPANPRHVVTVRGLGYKLQP